nr:MAG TPA: Fibronectin type III protein [Caudoviricetes sp.]
MTSSKAVDESSPLNGKVTTEGKGDVRIWAGEFTGGDLTTAPFTVTSAGKLNATDADITGTVNSKSGNIGGFTISDKSLVSESGSIIKFFNR